MPELLLSLYFSYKNALIAKAKGFNTVIWVLFTLLAFLAGEFLAIAIVMALFYRGPLDPKLAIAYMFEHPIHIIFVYFTAVGGCLFIRYILERMRSNLPEPPKEEDSETDNYE